MTIAFLLQICKKDTFISKASKYWIMTGVNLVALSRCFIDYWILNRITFRMLIIIVIVVANLNLDYNMEITRIIVSSDN